MLEVKKKDNESFESLIRRFTRKTIQSGKIIQAKKIRFYQKPISKRAQKAKALRREEIKKQREYLRKIGKLDDILDNNRRSGNKRK
ncbi:MAG: 30S ribosomal protein S21 [Candidatus Komeilibacteria bacterium]|nr:30S ribosomal protein S21 [Candidatus Komeilibacteria bacterium]